MARNLQHQLKEVGSKLGSSLTTKESVVKLLKQASACLVEMDQLPSKSALDSIHPFTSVIISPELLKNNDRDIKLLVAMCLSEITRITAPEAPYEDQVLKDIFQLIISTFSGLSDINSPSFGRSAVMLETLAKYRSCVVLLDLECDDLVKEVFQIFFSMARNDHPQSVLISMERVMSLLLNEREDVPEDILLTLLSKLGGRKNDATIASQKLALSVIKQCSVKLEPGIKKFLVSEMSRNGSSVGSSIDYHTIIYNIYCYAPLVLSGLVPYLIGELLADELNIRLKAVRLVGDLFSVPRYDILESFQPLFSELLKRLTDKALEVRMEVLEQAKICLLSNPSRSEASLIISSLCDRLLDYDANVRRRVISIVSDIACHIRSSVTVETLKLIAERLRDKSLLVKRYAMDRLAEIYAACSSDSAAKSEDFDWIPGKILRCLYDKDFKSDAIESLLCQSVFPKEYSIKDNVERWVRVFSTLEKVEVTALEKILEQKKRVQQEMQKYLFFKKENNGNDAPDFQKKVQLSFRIMSRIFTDPLDAEEKFRMLHHLKDVYIWKHFATLLDPCSSFFQVSTSQDDLLKKLGEKHSLYSFVSMLSLKCSYILFNKEHILELLLEASRHSDDGNSILMLSCMDLLVIIAHFSPLLFSESGGKLLQLLEEENEEIIQEGILHVLAMAGGSIREQLHASLSSTELLLERICIERSPKQAKYAVHAMAAIADDDGLRSLSFLYQRLVDNLERRKNLPTLLQSLGSIARTAMPVFETRESEVENFIVTEILECSSKIYEIGTGNWDDRSELCSWKIFGIKTLAKSYIPVKDAHLRTGVEKLVKILRDVLSTGEISKDVESSSVDKAHLRLASAKAILRLSRHWDHKIPIDAFHLTLWRGVEANFPLARKIFLNKVHQYIKDCVLDAKYACAFLFDVIGLRQPDFEENQHRLRDIIRAFQQTKTPRQPHILCDGAANELAYPERIIPYAVHALSHHPLCPQVEECTDEKAFDLIYKRLEFLFSALVSVDDDDGNVEATDRAKETATVVASILEAIKSSNDVVDASKSKNSYAICDLGLTVVKNLVPRLGDSPQLAPSFCLPPSLYRSITLENNDNAPVAPVVTENASPPDKSAAEGVERLPQLKTEVPLNTFPSEDIMTGEFRDEKETVPLGRVLDQMKESKKKKKIEEKIPPPPSRRKMRKSIHEINCSVSVDFHNSQKRKGGAACGGGVAGAYSSSTSVPKRHRSSSSSAQVPCRFSFVTRITGTAEALPSPKTAAVHSPSHKIKSRRVNEKSEHVKPCVVEPLNTSSTREAGAGGDSMEHKAKALLSTSNLGSKSSVLSHRRRRKRSVSAFAKCATKEAMEFVGRRIKVWWPLDKQFYDGVVKSYDAVKRKHVILYDDGDIEFLSLDRERCLFTDTHKPVKTPGLRNSVPDMVLKLDFENKWLTIVRRKRTPRKQCKDAEKRKPADESIDEVKLEEEEAATSVGEE